MNVDAEIREYMEFEESMRSALEAKYTAAIYSGAFADAYEILGKMMAYKLIPFDDERITSTNKMFVAGGVDKGHRFRLDYRTSRTFIPEWLFGSLLYNKVCKVNTIAHSGKRVEGNYCGDTIFSSFCMTIKVNFCNSRGKILAAFDAIQGINKKAKISMNLDGVKELALRGIYRVYEVYVVDNCLSKYGNLGYAIVRMTDNGIVTSYFPKYNAFLGTWLPIQESLQAISNTLRGITNGSAIRIMIDPSKAIKEQQTMVQDSNSTIENNRIKVEAASVK